MENEKEKNSQNSANSQNPLNFIAVAKIVKSRGLRGEMVAEILTDFHKRFDALENIVALLPNGERQNLKIEGFRFQKNRILLKFAEIETVEAAETLRDAEICIPESEAVALEDDEFYDWQLENCQVTSIEGEQIGLVKELMRTGGTEILVVAGANEKDFLIPFAKTICTEVDIENKTIRVDLPEGLLEF